MGLDLLQILLGKRHILGSFRLFQLGLVRPFRGLRFVRLLPLFVCFRIREPDIEIGFVRKFM
jgi:hypothetical protein